MSYREVSQQFGVGVSIVEGIVTEVCQVMEKHLLPVSGQLGNYKEVTLIFIKNKTVVCAYVITMPSCLSTYAIPMVTHWSN